MPDIEDYRRDIDFTKQHIIPYSKLETEFEIQAMLYNILKYKDGYVVKGEVKAYRSRLDIVVYDKQFNAKVIIEVKARKRIRQNYRKYKQVDKYEKLFNLPVIVCHDRSKVGKTLNEVRRIMNVQAST